MCGWTLKLWFSSVSGLERERERKEGLARREAKGLAERVSAARFHSSLLGLYLLVGYNVWVCIYNI